MATNAKKMQAQDRGARGEEIAAQWYRNAGYTIVARNWRCFEGEIDIIARRGRAIVICEVKARAGGSAFDPALAVSPSKQAKVRTATFRWLEEANQYQGRVRFDVALVIDDKVSVIKGAF